MAREQAPQLRADTAAVEAAQARSVAAGRLPDPELSTGVDDLPVTSQDAGSFTRDSMTMQRLGLMQSFPSAGKRSAERRFAQSEVTLARAQTQQTQLVVAQAAAEAWVQVYAATQLASNLEALRPTVELQVAAVNAAVRAARASSVDALAAQTALLELQDRVLEARGEIQLARAVLARWVGPEAYGAELGAAPEFGTLPRNRESVLASLHEHASLQVFDAEIERARTAVERARADKSPDWAAGLSYGRRSEFSDMLTLEFRVGLPLFSGSRQDPMISAKRAELAQVEAQRETELRMHREEVANALARWQVAHERIELYQQQRLPLAQQRTEAALAGFRSGTVALSDLLTSIVAGIELQRGQTQLLRELGQAWVFLRYLSLSEVRP